MDATDWDVYHALYSVSITYYILFLKNTRARTLLSQCLFLTIVSKIRVSQIVREYKYEPRTKVDQKLSYNVYKLTF